MTKKETNGRSNRPKTWIMRLKNNERIAIRYLLYLALNINDTDYSEDESKIYQKLFDRLERTEEEE